MTPSNAASPLIVTPDSRAAKSRMLTCLTLVCGIQKTYGRAPDDLELLVDGFMWALHGHALPDVLAAIREYCAAHDDIPAPANILAILNPPPEKPPHLSEAFYARLARKRRVGDFVSDDELRFMRVFEQEQIRRAESIIQNR